jgi:hypothetical protein
VQPECCRPWRTRASRCHHAGRNCAARPLAAAAVLRSTHCSLAFTFLSGSGQTQKRLPGESRAIVGERPLAGSRTGRGRSALNLATSLPAMLNRETPRHRLAVRCDSGSGEGISRAALSLPRIACSVHRIEHERGNDGPASGRYRCPVFILPRGTAGSKPASAVAGLLEVDEPARSA